MSTIEYFGFRALAFSSSLIADQRQAVLTTLMGMRVIRTCRPVRPTACLPSFPFIPNVGSLFMHMQQKTFIVETQAEPDWKRKNAIIAFKVSVVLLAEAVLQNWGVEAPLFSTAHCPTYNFLPRVVNSSETPGKMPLSESASVEVKPYTVQLLVCC